MAAPAGRVASASLAALALTLLSACANGPMNESPRELKTASDQTATEKRAQIRLQLAVGYYQDRKYEIALDEVKKAIAADPGYADAYGFRALIYVAMGENALADWRRATRTCPTTTGCSCAKPAASRPRP